MRTKLSERIEEVLEGIDRVHFGEIEVITEELDDVFGGHCGTMACGNYRKPN
jgi:hypothetical protein